MKVVPNGVFPLVLNKMKAELGQRETWGLQGRLVTSYLNLSLRYHRFLLKSL